MHVFVTGASGLIGGAVIQELIRSGHSVLGLVRSDKSAEKVKALGAEVLRGDLSDLSVLKYGAASSDGVIHLAFIHDFDNFGQSCQTDREAIKAMGAVLAWSDRPLLITSGTMLLRQGQVGTEDDSFDPKSPNFSLRGESEELAKRLASEGVRTAIMRLAPVNHGDGDDHMFISNLITVARRTRVAAYIGEGLNHWPAVHYLDTAVAYRLALEKATPGTTYHVVAERGVALRDIVGVIGQKLGIPVESKSFEDCQKSFSHFASVVMADNVASSAKTQAALGWTPTQCTLLTDLERGKYLEV
ncbi:hypothetical protein ACHAPE_008010 [Trichoderma viride]